MRHGDPRPLRVGVISDTHGTLRPRVFEIFAEVDRILHAGDVGRVEILTDLAVLAPVSAVWGNVDGHEVRAATEESLLLGLGGVRVAVAHGHQVRRFDALVERFPQASVIVHGHSHEPRWDRRGDVWLLNPGAAGPAEAARPPSVAVLEVVGREVAAIHYDLRTGVPFRP